MSLLKSLVLLLLILRNHTQSKQPSTQKFVWLSCIPVLRKLLLSTSVTYMYTLCFDCSPNPERPGDLKESYDSRDFFEDDYVSYACCKIALIEISVRIFLETTLNDLFNLFPNFICQWGRSQKKGVRWEVLWPANGTLDLSLSSPGLGPLLHSWTSSALHSKCLSPPRCINKWVPAN